MSKDKSEIRNDFVQQAGQDVITLLSDRGLSPAEMTLVIMALYKSIEMTIEHFTSEEVKNSN